MSTRPAPLQGRAARHSAPCSPWSSAARPVAVRRGPLGSYSNGAGNGVATSTLVLAELVELAAPLESVGRIVESFGLMEARQKLAASSGSHSPAGGWRMACTFIVDDIACPADCEVGARE